MYPLAEDITLDRSIEVCRPIDQLSTESITYTSETGGTPMWQSHEADMSSNIG